MKARDYQLIHIPRGLYSLRMLVIIFSPLILIFLLVPLSKSEGSLFLMISISCLTPFIIWKLSRRLVRNDMNMILKHDSVVIIEKSTISKKTRKQEIKWNNLESYLFETTAYYHILRLLPSTGKRIVLTFDLNNPDFSGFEFDFRRKVAAFNKIGNTFIATKPSFYETKSGKIVAVILGVLMIIWPIVVWLNDKPFNIGLAIMFYSQAGFYLYMVVKSIRNTTDQNSHEA